ncbi:hypothetical protein Tco_0925259 [Tanacetum coccineum]|uniref:Uncharacterized protein n=1 Tax=Tanacetum coccineum TaxID=301880 RepID=A0ABQ5D7L2_9ASTR
MPTTTTGCCLVVAVAMQRDVATAAALSMLMRTHLSSGVRTILKDLRYISRIKSSSRHEVTIPNLVFRCSEIWGYDRLVSEPLGYRELGRNQEMSQSLSSNVPDNSPEQEAATEHSIPRRLDSPTSQTAQLPGLELTLTPATDAITFSDGKPASETSELNPEDVTARLEDLEVEIDTLHADTEDKELLISEL